MLELRSGQNVVGILPKTGASLAFWRDGATEILIPVSDPNLEAQQGVAVAGYPLIPYSNRIANGQFSFDGQDYRLTPNMRGEKHSIHGNAWEHEWQIAQHDADRAILFFDHKPRDGRDFAEWPFPYRAVISFILSGEALQIEILVANRGTSMQPVGFGFHPFFLRTPDMRVAFHARGVWENDAAHLPNRLLSSSGEWDFASSQSVESRDIDHCFAGWAHEARLSYPEAGYNINMMATSNFDHLVMFTSPEKPFVALEAVTNMNDAIHHPELLDAGLSILRPGESISGTVTYRIDRETTPAP